MIKEGLNMENFVFDADKWDKFKDILSQEDKANLEIIMNRAKINAGSEQDLNTSLTKSEKVWRAKFVWDAILWGLY